MNISLIVVFGVVFVAILAVLAGISFTTEVVRCRCGFVSRVPIGVEDCTCENCGFKYKKPL